ncbi:MAG: hypothetical protein E7657_03955 [Ruminococcaceae bacterium]|nr:hypothetical protein [Oscillospiraceae bacterium]
MKKARIVCLLLALVLCLGVLASCDGGGGGADGGDRGEDGSWASVDFDGQKVRLCVSAHQTPECNFPAADIYTKGPDTAGSNEVAKEVLARNKAAEETLGIEIEYETRNLYYDKVIEDVENIVMTASKNSPDIYNNDCASLAYSMVSGYLWNVKNPGDGIKNYFDFSKDGWYEEFIKGCTFNQDKYYMFAGDYFIDMIRMAWVIYVNNNTLAANIESVRTALGSDVNSVDAFYDFVSQGFWDMDALARLANAAHSDSGEIGVTEKSDTTVGFVYVNNSNWAFSAGSGVTLYYQDENYEPKVMQDYSKFQLVANKFQNLEQTPGVLKQQQPQDATSCFLQGNFLFAISRLGEMESEALREFKPAKGLVPIPKWSVQEQDDYITTLHDQVEIGAILNTAQAFSASSALMQYLNEESEKVVYTYYEKGLKFKYNDDKNNREMMDLIRETVGSPFGFQIGDHCQDFYTGTGKLKGMYITDSSLASTFASEKDAYNDCMAKMIEHFKQLP